MVVVTYHLAIRLADGWLEWQAETGGQQPGRVDFPVCRFTRLSSLVFRNPDASGESRPNRQTGKSTLHGREPALTSRHEEEPSRIFPRTASISATNADRIASNRRAASGARSSTIVFRIP